MIPDSSDDGRMHNTELQKKKSVPPWKTTNHIWQIHRKRATEAVAEEVNDHTFTFKVEPVNLTDAQLNKLLSDHKRSCHFHNVETNRGGKNKYYDASLGKGHVIHVKRSTDHTWIKRTRWNEWCTRSSSMQHQHGSWRETRKCRRSLHWDGAKR